MTPNKPLIWPNHRSQPIFGTRFYRWALWIDGDDKVRQTIRSVTYKLHPTFEHAEVVSEDLSNQFRIDARGWGSFYIRVILTYHGGFVEEIPYFLDVKQFFRHEGPRELKRCRGEQMDEGDLRAQYQSGCRDFSGVRVSPSSKAPPLSRANLVGICLLRADLRKVRFHGANLAMANLQDADLSGADLSGANLTATRLTGAKLDGAVLYGINRTDWMFDDARATHVYLDPNSKTRVPYSRDFAPEEFVSWLASVKDLPQITPPASPKVFISYSWKDEETVLAVDQWLRDHGVEVLIDKRDFVVGQDLYEEITSKILQADKVVVFYSSNSKDRPYTTLERRVAQEVEMKAKASGHVKSRVVYFHLDDEEAPLEVAHRLSIRAKGLLFEVACQQLLNAILGRGNPSPAVDLSAWRFRTL